MDPAMTIELPEASITVHGDPYKYDMALLKAFEDLVAAIIRGQIATTKLGQIVLSRIKRGPGDVEIYPRYEQGLNAEADFKMKDRGVGRDLSKIVIWYKPEQWKATLPPSRTAIPNDLRAWEPGLLRDEVLFHELVHSGRLLEGFWPQKREKLAPDPDNPVPWASDDGAPYDDIEEFATILVSNIYLSEKGQKVFRASHGDPKYPLILDQAQSSSEGFLKKPAISALVKTFCQTDPMAPAIAEIDTPFNPVRAYLKANPADVDLNKSLQPKR
jgi:hypothetical protein